MEPHNDSLFLSRYCGGEVFPIHKATWRLEYKPRFLRDYLCLDIQLGRQVGLKEGDARWNITPHWRVAFPMVHAEHHEFKEGMLLELPYGYIDHLEEYYALFTYHESIPTFKNRLKVISVDGQRLQLELEAVTEDVEHYDSTKPLASIAFTTWFTPQEQPK